MNRPFDSMVHTLGLSKRINVGGFRLSLRCEVLALLVSQRNLLVIGLPPTYAASLPKRAKTLY